MAAGPLVPWSHLAKPTGMDYVLSSQRELRQQGKTSKMKLATSSELPLLTRLELHLLKQSTRMLGLNEKLSLL